jgi:hypothetical protein
MDQDNRSLSQMNEDDKRLQTPEGIDLPDSKRDAERLEPDQATLDLPDVSDIPGQEHVHVLPLGDLADTTASSDDEEGTDVLGE